MKIAFKFLMVTTVFLIISCNKAETTDPVIEEESFDFVVGDAYQGGIIFYIDDTGEHGLIAYTEDLGEGTWGCYYSDDPDYLPPFSPIAQATGIGFGAQNTQAIVDFCDDTNSAARISYNLDANSYDDWYLPSIDELALVYQNRISIGGFPDLSETEFPYIYASSSEGPGAGYDNEGTIFYGRSFVYDFSDIPIIEDTRELLSTKHNDFLVRPIRSF